ncbi:DNA polymerase III subunit delta' [Advenella faeciporci]|uniref:DNA polymerase III subunit delta n=1 Tax=Advenella faeciporci TaxID=797535 RepID=A0A918MX43_9BURK|nr:DNA polymerase III subunit delta' [Advenella faeciporci]GGW78035.1 DNA polymerase III subunit delta' [Advenella faeciporci]
MHLPEFLPWQKDIASQWLGNKERFSHAWIIYGIPGIGKLKFAHAAATGLLCESSLNGMACGHCESCGWVKSGNHPDLRIVLPDATAVKEGFVTTPENDEASGAKKTLSQDIRIEQVRQLEKLFNVSTHRGGYRVIVLYPAESLNAASSNALLKVLEEPPENTIFLLVTHAIQRLLPTLLSRCRRLALPVPESQVALDWLQKNGVADGQVWLAATGGAPLSALAFSQSDYEPVKYWLSAFADKLAHREMPNLDKLAELLEKLQAKQWLDSLQRFVFDINLNRYGQVSRYFPTLGKNASIIAGNMAADKITQLLKWLTEQQRIADHPLNARLFIMSTLQRVALSCISKS